MIKEVLYTKHLLINLVVLGGLCIPAQAIVIQQSPAFYRNQVLALPACMSFEAPTPLGSAKISYKFTWGDPAIAQPFVGVLPVLGSDVNGKYIEFYDRIYLAPDSVLNVNGKKIPLTCAWVHGQDNSEIDNNDPLVPKQLLRILLVANDFSCTGPVNPGWPGNGQRKETWDTYLDLMIKDLTIYRPADARLRYRWSESKMIVNGVGPKQSSSSGNGEPEPDPIPSPGNCGEI